MGNSSSKSKSKKDQQNQRRQTLPPSQRANDPPPPVARRPLSHQPRARALGSPTAASSTQPAAESTGGAAPVVGNPNATWMDAFAAALTGGPEGDSLTDPRMTGMKPLPHDGASGKLLMSPEASLLAFDEQYPGPLSWADYVKWEAACDQLDYSKRIKKGQDPDPGLCRRCRRLCLFDGEGFTTNKAIRFQPFGTLFQLLARSRCRICRLIVISISCGTYRLHPLLGQIDPEAQFTQLFSETLPSGETVLSIEYGLRKVGVIRMVKPENHWQLLRQSHEIDYQPPFQKLLDDTSVFHNRAGQVASTALVKGWIATCEQQHGASCNSAISRSERHRGRLIILIDVQRRCLVEEEILGTRYLALSYVWGQVTMPYTLRSNFRDRQMENSLPKLPSSIEDAMIMVTAINERFLWVDALCILQDDNTQKHTDIQNMDSIYGCAIATLIALSGSSADAGLPGVRPGTRNPQPIEVPQLFERLAGPGPAVVQRLDELARTAAETHKAWMYPTAHATTLAEYTHWIGHVLSRNTKEDLAEKKPKTPNSLPTPIMVAHPPSLKHILTMSPWNTRGWTLQERLLSRRCIYFSSEYIYFQCAEHTLSETGGNIFTWTDITPTYSNTTHVQRAAETNPLLHFRRPPPTHDVIFEENSITGVLARQDFDVYMELIRMHSSRHLSFSADAIKSISGILAVAHKRMGGKMIAGLPTKYLDLALLWSPAEPHDRTTPVGRPGNEHPSWSWAAWSGGKEYRQVESDIDRFGTLERIFASSEIETFRVYSDGEMVEIFKSKDAWRATEPRQLGESAKLRAVPFPKYLPYSERVIHGASIPALGANVLEFSTFVVGGDYFTVAMPDVKISSPEHGCISGNQEVTPLLDGKSSKQCGFLFKPQSKTRYRTLTMGRLEYLLISSFGDAHERRSGIATMNPSFKPFDEYAYPWKGAGSGLVNLLLVEWFGDFAERLSTAQIHRQAWEAAAPVKKTVRLA